MRGQEVFHVRGRDQGNKRYRGKTPTLPSRLGLLTAARADSPGAEVAPVLRGYGG